MHILTKMCTHNLHIFLHEPTPHSLARLLARTPKVVLAMEVAAVVVVGHSHYAARTFSGQIFFKYVPRRLAKHSRVILEILWAFST